MPDDLALFVKRVMSGTRKLDVKRDSNIDTAARAVANCLKYDPKDSHRTIFPPQFFDTQAKALGLGIRKAVKVENF